MTRACQCGGIVRQHQLTGEREAWTCNACGRYGAIPRGEAGRIQEIAAETGLSVESVRLFSWIDESGGWTAEAAHKAFGHLA
jgi:hypothetical protein